MCKIYNLTYVIPNTSASEILIKLIEYRSTKDLMR